MFQTLLRLRDGSHKYIWCCACWGSRTNVLPPAYVYTVCEYSVIQLWTQQWMWKHLVTQGHCERVTAEQPNKGWVLLCFWSSGPLHTLQTLSIVSEWVCCEDTVRASSEVNQQVLLSDKTFTERSSQCRQHRVPFCKIVCSLFQHFSFFLFHRTGFKQFATSTVCLQHNIQTLTGHLHLYSLMHWCCV